MCWPKGFLELVMALLIVVVDIILTVTEGVSYRDKRLAIGCCLVLLCLVSMMVPLVCVSSELAVFR